MRKYIFLAALVACAACEDDYEWQPGDRVAAGTHKVFFSSDNEAIIGHEGGAEATFTLTVERTGTQGALSVPIVVTDSVGSFRVPATVEFADGDDTADLLVGYTYRPGLELTLGFGDGFGNPYLVQDGTVSFKCRVARIVRLCKVKYEDKGEMKDVVSYIDSYEGINRFRFCNFMDSGVDINFTVDTKHTGATFDAADLKALSGDFKPIDNCYADGTGWYLWDEKNEVYPTWVPTGWDAGKPVHYYYFYGYYEEYSYSYSFIDFSNKKYSYFFGSSFYFDDDMTESVSPTIKYTLDYKAVSGQNE